LALGELADARAVSVLVQTLRDPDVLVQRTTAQALAQIGTAAAANALVAALGSSQPSVVFAAMNSLQDLGELAVLPLTRALASDNALLRLNAATMLGYIASPQALPALQLATADPDPAVRAEVAWALAQIQNQK
jgi:HEAT repeat protein